MDSTPRSIDRILVPIDFSRYTDSVLSTAAFFAQSHNAAVDVLHVWTPPFAPPKRWGVEPPNQPPAGDNLSDYQRALDIAQKTLGMLGVTQPIATRLVEGTASRTILQLASEGQFDLIVVGNHGQTGLSQAYVGSVTERVVRSSRIPVLVVPSTELGDGT
jgi:nucleotide-binding universal stress UspA family protein